MDPSSIDPSRPKTNAMNNGIVRLTPSRQPTFADDERGIDNQLEKFETAPETEEQLHLQQQTSQDTTRTVQLPDRSADNAARLDLQRSNNSYISNFSTKSVPPPGSVLTGKQEHCM